MAVMHKLITENEIINHFLSNDQIHNYSNAGQVCIFSSQVPHIIEETIKACEFNSLEFNGNQIDTLTFLNCKIQRLKITITIRSNISFTNCQISELIIDINEFKYPLPEGDNKSQDPKSLISITGKKTKINTALLFGTFHQVYIEHAKIKNFCTNSAALKIIGIKNSKISDLKFYGNLDYVTIDTLSSGSHVTFQNSDSQVLDIQNCEGCSFSISGSKIKEFFGTTQIKNCSLTIMETEIKLSKIIGSYNQLTLQRSNSINLNILSPFDSLNTIDNLLISYFNNDKNCTIVFNKMVLDCVTIENVYNDSLMGFNDCEIKRNLSLYKSSLGKTTFSNISLNKKCEVDMIDCNIENVLFANFRWPNNYLLSHNFTKDKYNSFENYLINLRESYRQLKSNYIKNGNKIESLEFQRNEMGIHYLILADHKFDSLKMFGNYLIVGSNKLFSDFGQTIWRPLIFLFGIHFLLFNIILWTNDDIGFSIRPDWDLDWLTIQRGIGLYFQTLLPTHFATVKNINNNDISIAGFWDFLMRIMSSYFIFYFITATRKYHQ